MLTSETNDRINQHGKAEMGVKFIGIEPSSSFSDEVPMCPHGPMLLFERHSGARKGGRQFYACSACRDRKQCGFFLWRDERLTAEKAQQWRERVSRQTRCADRHRERYNSGRCVVESGGLYCLDCSRLVPASQVTSHTTHETRPVKQTSSPRPSEVLRPLSCSRVEAQYLFSEETVCALQTLLRGAGATRVLCCGAPRLHETLVTARVDSLMLDYDHRYEEFWPPEKLCIYNMFNHHMFSSEGWDVYRDFVGRDGGNGLALFIDPPFGGRVEALALTIQKIRSDCGADKGLVPVFLVLPYFNEPDVLTSLPEMHMTDFRVEYDNHTKYTSAAGGRKFGSPVRLFTSLPPEDVELPGPEYRLCQPCRRWVHTDNRHCDLCDSCTSKDGRPYRHCEPCGRCVKESWQHCRACGRCGLPDHPCAAAGSGPDPAHKVHRAKKRRRK